MHRPDEVATAELIEVEGQRCAGLPESEGVDRLAPIADHRSIEGGAEQNHWLLGEHSLRAVLQANRRIELDRDGFLWAAHFPGVGLTQPEVGLFDLIAILDLLAKHPIMIA